MRNYCLTGTEFLFGITTKLGKSMVVTVYDIANVLSGAELYT